MKKILKEIGVMIISAFLILLASVFYVCAVSVENKIFEVEFYLYLLLSATLMALMMLLILLSAKMDIKKENKKKEL